MLSEHPKKLSGNSNQCNKCGESLCNSDTFSVHICRNQTKCDQCDFKGDSVTEFIQHLLETHEKNLETIQCPHCDFKAISMQTINDHIDTDHIEIALLGHVAANQSSVSDSFEKFKTELTNILNVISYDHNTIKQELFILRQSKQESYEKMERVEVAVTNLANKMSTKSSTTSMFTTGTATSESIQFN